MGRLIGRVESLVPMVSLTIDGVIFHNVVVDTGFTGFLTITEEFVNRHNLPKRGIEEVKGLDGTSIIVSKVEVDISWLGQDIKIPAIIIGSTTVIGMNLLFGTRLVIDEIAGVLTIETSDSANE